MNNQCRSSDSPVDPNNNFSPTMKGYSLRPRSSRKCEESVPPPEPEDWRPPKNKRKQKSLPLSKYRRKTANARERSRMREINEAFESLRRAIPHVSVQDCSSEKLTKITTLRLAMKYISALNNVLHDQELESDGESLFSDYTLTPPDVRDFSITSPAFSSPESFVPELFHPLLHSELDSVLPPLIDPQFETPLASVDPSLAAAESVFDNSSYVFEDAPFLTDFS